MKNMRPRLKLLPKMTLMFWVHTCPSLTLSSTVLHLVSEQVGGKTLGRGPPD